MCCVGAEVRTTRRGVFIAEAVSNERVCEDHRRLCLRARGFPPTCPGQFVQVQCRPPAEPTCLRELDWPADRLPRLAQAELADREPFLRRPFSLAGRRDRPDGAVELDVIYRVKGAGTRWLSGIAPGGGLSILGPLGNAFTIRPEKPQAALVGGGVGIPPMIYLAGSLAAAGRRAVAFHGARAASVLPLRAAGGAGVSSAPRPARCVAEFDALGVDSVIATDDGSLGFRGLVSDAFRAWLDAAAPRAADLVVYSCGPEAMMRAVAETCRSRDVECQLALERHMACGMGTCQSCVVKVRDDSERGWSFKLCCTDGPVFDAGAVLW